MRSNIKVTYGIIITLFMFITSSCSNDDDNSVANYKLTYAISADAASPVGFVGETILIDISFVVMNGCGEFGRFIESGIGLNKNILIEAKYEGLICTQDLPIRKTTYEFTPNAPGEYVFKFKSGPDIRFGESGPDQFITVTVLVSGK